MPWLFDTNVISEIWKPRPNANVLAFSSSIRRDQIFLSIVSIAEFLYGASTVVDERRRRELQTWVAHEIRPLFRDRVMPLSEEILLRWLSLVGEGRRANRTFSQPDLFLAATALEHDLTLVTRNVRDFAGIADLKLLNPWETQP